MVILLLFFISSIENDFNYLQEELLSLKENPIEDIKEVEIIPYLDELTIKKIKEMGDFSEIDQRTLKKIRPFIKLKKAPKPKFYYYFYLKDGEFKNKVRYFSFFDYHWEGKDETIIHYLKFGIKNFNFHLGDLTIARSLSLIFSSPHYLPIEEYQNLYKKEVRPATIKKRDKSFSGLLFSFDKGFCNKFLITNKVFGLFKDFSIKDFKNELSLFYFLKEKIGFSYCLKKYFKNSFLAQEIAFTNKKEVGYALKIFFRYNFFSYNLNFAFLNKSLSPYTYYRKKDFPYFQFNIENDFKEILFQINYLSFFNYEYDSFPHRVSFIIKKEEDNNFSWQLKINRYLRLTKIRNWSNSFLIKKDFKNLTFAFLLSDYYREERELRRKYLISPRIKARIKDFWVAFYYYLNYFNKDFKTYYFEKEILEEHSLKEDIRNRYLFQITYKFKNLSLKLKFSFDKGFDYLTYFSMKI